MTSPSTFRVEQVAAIWEYVRERWRYVNDPQGRESFAPARDTIANGFAGMGFAVPAAIAAKLVHPERRVVPVCGDGGFLMNVQELETAVRLKTPFVNVVWEDKRFGSIAWKQRRRFGDDFGTEFTNPDFVRLAESFGLPAWRVTKADEFGGLLRHAIDLPNPSLIVLEIDYEAETAIADLRRHRVSIRNSIPDSDTAASEPWRDAKTHVLAELDELKTKADAARRFLT